MNTHNSLNNNNYNNNYNNNNNNNNKSSQLDINLNSFIGLHYFQKDLFELESNEHDVEKTLQNLQKQLGHLTCIQSQQQQLNIQQKSQNSIVTISEQIQLQKMINIYSERVQSCFQKLTTLQHEQQQQQQQQESMKIDNPIDYNFTDSNIKSILDDFELRIPPERPTTNNNNNINSQYNNNNNSKTKISIDNFEIKQLPTNVIINTNYIQEYKQQIESNRERQRQQDKLDLQRKHQEEKREQERQEQIKRDQQREQQLQQQREQQRLQNNNGNNNIRQGNNNSNNNRTSTMVLDDDESSEINSKSDFKSAKDQFIDNQVSDKNKKNPSVVSNTIKKMASNSVNNSNNAPAPTPSAPSTAPGGRKRKFVPPVKQDESEEQEDQNKKQLTSKRNIGGSGGGGNIGNSGGGNAKKDDETNPNGFDNVNGVPLDDDRLRNLEPVMLERICNEILDKKQETKWSDIAGLQEVKEQILEMVVYPIVRPELFRGLRIPPKGLLLFGPPGTGKTMIGKAIANQVKATFFSISASTLTSKWIGEGEKMVRCLFAVARCFLPSVIFIDEIDSLLTQRSDNENEASRRIKTEFLIQWDGVAGNAEDHMLLIGATNRPDELDEAARRRMSKRLYIPLPDFESRLALVQNLLKNETHHMTMDDMKQIADVSEGYSGADMKSLSTEAAYQPIRDLRGAIESIDMHSIRAICLNDFILAKQRVKPSVDKKELNSYIEWNNKFGALS